MIRIRDRVADTRKIFEFGIDRVPEGRYLDVMARIPENTNRLACVVASRMYEFWHMITRFPTMLSYFHGILVILPELQLLLSETAIKVGEKEKEGQ